MPPGPAPVVRSSDTAFLRSLHPLLAALPLAAGCASGPHAGRWFAAAGALAVLVSVVIASLMLAQRRRAAEAAAWQDAARIAELMRAGMVGELQRWVVRELGTPVASLLNNLGAVRRLLASGQRGGLPDVIPAVDEACTEAERVALVIRRMPELLGSNASRREPLDLDEIAREAIRLVERMAEAKRVKVSAALAGTLPPVRADSDQLLQVVVSLVLHGIENASAPHGAVEVRTAGRDAEVELVVGDSGPAISEVDRTYLFTPLASMTSYGVGLSVATIRSIVETYGGRVSAERPESGALFRVVLPAAAVASANR